MRIRALCTSTVAAMIFACLSDACSGNVAITGDGSDTTDGTPGACCTPSMGGCANIGGFRADGNCGLGRQCDNMCGQRIVDDEHGCKKMIYTPCTNLRSPDSGRD